MAQEEDERARQLLEALPAAIYTTDAGGRITFYNRAAAALWGRYPPASSRWCGSWRLYWPDGRPMPHDQCSMAVAIKQDRAVRSTEAIAERPDGTWFAFAPFPTPLHDTAGRVIGAVNMLVDITAHKNAEQHLHLLMLELDHRTKNMLAGLQGVIRCTKAETTREFAAEGRIMALARAHSLFSQHGWQGVDMRRLLEDGLTPYRIAADVRRISIEGPAVKLLPSVAQLMAMMIHELAMNAAKYGALSQEQGRIAVSWSYDSAEVLTLRWQEIGAPEMQPPKHRGFGMTLIERTVSDQLDGIVHFDWPRDGLVCHFYIPLRRSSRFVA